MRFWRCDPLRALIAARVAEVHCVGLGLPARCCLLGERALTRAALLMRQRSDRVRVSAGARGGVGRVGEMARSPGPGS